MERSRELTRKLGFRWRCPSCSKRVSPLDNTFIEHSPDLVLALRLTACWIFREPVTKAALFCGCSKTTAIGWYDHCRKVAEIVISHDVYQIGGPNLFVEVDETHLSERKDHHGRQLPSESIWVFGGICRESGDCFVVRVLRRNKETLWPIMLRRITQGSIIVTDSARVYEGCESLGYAAHYSVCHKSYFVCPTNPQVHTNTIERQ
jgi:hypothetical protein